MKLLVHGSGFRRPYRNDPEELRCGKPKEVRGNPDCNWFPSSLDGDSLGRSSGGSTPVGTIADLLAVIRAQSLDSIEELRIIGHANGKFIAFAGTTLPDKIVFTENAMIGILQHLSAPDPDFAVYRTVFGQTGAWYWRAAARAESDRICLIWSATRCCALWPDLRNPFSTPSMGRPKDPS